MAIRQEDLNQTISGKEDIDNINKVPRFVNDVAELRTIEGATGKICTLDNGTSYVWAGSVLTDNGTTIVVPTLAANTGSWILRDLGATVMAADTSGTVSAIAGQVWSNSGLLAVSGTDIPTSDPAVAGQIWADSGALKVSAG